MVMNWLGTNGILIIYIVPAVGGILSSVMYISPIRAAFKIHGSQELEEFNIFPYALMIFNTIVWTILASTLQAPSCYFVAFPNWIGLVSGVLILALTYPLANFQTRFRVLSVLLFIAGLFFPIIFTLSISNRDAFPSIMAYVTIIIQLLFFASPLLNAIQIIRTKSAAILYWPLALTASLSCGLWTIYGIVLAQMSIYLPNAIGCVFGITQMLLCCIYPSKEQQVVYQAHESDRIISVDPNEEETNPSEDLDT
jgi:solute carrier family 50 protein (sugar transporter)